MIRYLKGKISYKDERSIILEINSIGYQVFLSSPFLDKVKVNQEIKMHTHLYSREDTLELYGFEDEEELLFFHHLINISGIGPRSALGVLSLASPEKLKQAIFQEKPEILTKVSGIGKKTAERIIVELKSKIEKGKEFLDSFDEEVLDALVGLGYSLSQAREALKKVPSQTKDLKEKIRIALKVLNK